MMADSVKYAKCKWATEPSTAVHATNASKTSVRILLVQLSILFLFINHLDHHCPWLGTCIGARNYSAFVAYTLIYALLLLASAILGNELNQTFVEL